MSPEEAKEYGLIDNVVASKAEAEENGKPKAV
jgi:ATP-dependent protease ClpP protease subunit